jgi:hypothetical protein
LAAARLMRADGSDDDDRAALILRAAAPWSPGTHALFPAGAKARAVELLRVGWLLARQLQEQQDRLANGAPDAEMAFRDAWPGHVMPLATERASAWRARPGVHARAGSRRRGSAASRGAAPGAHSSWRTATLSTAHRERSGSSSQCSSVSCSLAIVIEAVRASPWRAFWTVAVPLARPGFLTGAILGFAHTVGEFGVVLMIGGNIPGETKVLSVAIFDYVETSQWRQAHVLAGGMVVFSFCVILAMMLVEKRIGRPAQ